MRVVHLILAATLVAGLVNANPGGSRFCKNVRDDRKRMEYVVDISMTDWRKDLISDDEGSNVRGSRGPGLGPNPRGVLYLAAATLE